MISLRLRETEVDAQYPFLRSYLVAAEDMPHVFRWFGLCMSVPLTPQMRYTLATKPVEVFTEDRGELPVGTPWLVEVPDAARVVVLLRQRNKQWVDDWISKKLRKDIKEDSLRTTHVPDDTLIHTDRARHICTLCPRQLIFMAGGCTPGCADCPRHMVIPFDTHTKDAARRTHLPVYGDRT
jgi:hypothetical protein